MEIKIRDMSVQKANIEPEGADVFEITFSPAGGRARNALFTKYKDQIEEQADKEQAAYAIEYGDMFDFCVAHLKSWSLSVPYTPDVLDGLEPGIVAAIFTKIVSWGADEKNSPTASTST
jgi:hypothetical protein